MSDVSLVIRYEERGFVSIKHAEENVWLIVEDVEWMSERQDTFESQIKKAVAVFGKKNVHNVEMTLYENANGGIEEKRLALLVRETGDEENDIYTLYSYNTKLPQTLINKVSKAKALNELLTATRESVKRILEKIKESA